MIDRTSLIRQCSETRCRKRYFRFKLVYTMFFDIQCPRTHNLSAIISIFSAYLSTSRNCAMHSIIQTCMRYTRQWNSDFVGYRNHILDIPDSSLHQKMMSCYCSKSEPIKPAAIKSLPPPEQKFSAMSGLSLVSISFYVNGIRALQRKCHDLIPRFTEYLCRQYHTEKYTN